MRVTDTIMNIGIIEDEPIAAKRLEILLKEINPAINIVFILESIDEVITTFKKDCAIDLLLSDIELIDGNVFVALTKIEVTCPIIFITAYDHFLMDAFNNNGIGYLLKPFNKDSLNKVLDKYNQLKSNFTPFEQSFFNKLQSSFTPENHSQYKSRFTIKRHSGIELLKVDDISYFRLELSGLQAFDVNNHSYPLSDSSLSVIENQLDPRKFFRLNRNELVSIEAIEKITPLGKDRLDVFLISREGSFTCSAGRTPLFKQWLEQ
jgi:DNA-binding LytR/AlgR family response regulator